MEIVKILLLLIPLVVCGVVIFWCQRQQVKLAHRIENGSIKIDMLDTLTDIAPNPDSDYLRPTDGFYSDPFNLGYSHGWKECVQHLLDIESHEKGRKDE